MTALGTIPSSKHVDGAEALVDLGPDACNFCDDSLGFRAVSEDPFAFREHLAQHDDCRLEYEQWRGTLVDEWAGD